MKEFINRKYLIFVLLILFSCKENKQTKTAIDLEKKAPKENFYKKFLDHKKRKQSSNKFQLDTAKYFETYVLIEQSKLIQKNIESIKHTNFLNEIEIERLNKYEIFENYESHFINLNEFNSKKHKTKKNEIIYFFTYPFKVSKEKVLIGFEINHKSHPIEMTKGGSMGFFIFKKNNNSWLLIKVQTLKEY